jgi:hypothetical protein
MEADRYCAAVFLDVSQAFDKIWHERLLNKIKNSFPSDLYRHKILSITQNFLELNMEK